MVRKTSSVSNKSSSNSVLKNTSDESAIVQKDLDRTCLKILVVDDDGQVRDLLRDMLMMFGHTITTCNDGFSAIESLEKKKYNLMITDLGMPGMSGLELAKLANKDFPKMPIVMVTGWGSQLKSEEVESCGIQAVLPKPFHIRQIKDIIEGLD